MNSRNRFLLCGLSLICLVILAGCGKEKTPALNVPETTQQNTSLPEETEQPQDTTAPEQGGVPTFDYEPGCMGIYVKADPSIQVDPEVLDSITMTLSDKHMELTRKKVSNTQFDFVKQGHQIGGFLIVDIPREMLEKPPESWAEFEAIADLLAKQVMPDIYPSEAHISGGGHGFDMPVYMTFMIESDNKAQYTHRIYIGENYIYDFWYDNGWMADGGETIMSTLSAEDIKPELNQSDDWSIHDFPDFPGVPQG